ncbi:c-type cytochrome [Fulvivirga sediminis]|uniref:Cytochrome c n=1 Tax=Fulvivirga sediminis TaxID=2803949 RepID=A0A937F6U4_9BACT|nr:cytochrome c [Fulvivirga sediminis]MBL3655053.1 cytochrome c [Fulvivirga sediminis]
MRNLLVLVTACTFLLSCGKSSNSSSESGSIIKEAEKEPMVSKGDAKLDQYIYAGKELYDTHCSNCHQENGEGLASLYPPIKNSDYLDGRMKEVPCIIKNGIYGEITVNGKVFDQVMPGNFRLTDLEIAEITTFIYNSWGRSEGILNVKEVNKIMKECKKE